jgi:hypothetical protein
VRKSWTKKRALTNYESTKWWLWWLWWWRWWLVSEDVYRDGTIANSACRQMAGDWIFYHFQEHIPAIRRSNLQTMKQLYHQPREALKCPGYASLGTYFY